MKSQADSGASKRNHVALTLFLVGQVVVHVGNDGVIDLERTFEVGGIGGKRRIFRLDQGFRQVLCLDFDVGGDGPDAGDGVGLLHLGRYYGRFYRKVKNLVLEPGNGLVNCDKKCTANDGDKENHRTKGQSQLEQIRLGVGKIFDRIEQHKETKDGPNNEGGDNNGGHVDSYYGSFYRNVKP